MRKINLSAILILTLGVIVFLFFLIRNGADYLDSGSKIRIAVCPTFLSLVKDISESKKYEIILTRSTAESVDLFKNKKVDIILAGRTLKPGEPEMSALVIRDGYSFLGNREITIYNHELAEMIFYTNLDIEKIKDNLPIGKIYKVENVYNYLQKGIVVTSWENTDYNRAKTVHVLKDNGNRLELSRRPTIYFPEVYRQEVQDIISYIILGDRV